jgi:hypothetical protein
MQGSARRRSDTRIGWLSRGWLSIKLIGFQ